VGHCGSIPSSLLEGGLIVLAHAEDRESRDEKPGLPLNFHEGT
jgi:hypothetical protein